MKKDDITHHDCFFCFDFIDKLLILLLAVLVLLANIGVLGDAWIAYWPIFLVVWIIKEFLNEK